MSFWKGVNEEAIEKAIKHAVRISMADAICDTTSAIYGAKKASDLQKEITKLEIEKSKADESRERKDREVEHKIGLERARHEFEIKQATAEATLKVREENLAADKERFKAEMEFQRKHLEDEIGSLRTLVGQMMERLPSAEIYADLSGPKGRR